jgi:hypothetical protein
MKVERYRRKAHYATLETWWRGWNQRPPGPEALPKTGFVVAGTVAGFLYRTDSNIAILEAFIANPKSDADERNAALDAIVVALVKEAQRAGFTYLLAYTTVPAILRRAERFGFTVLREAHTLDIREL